MKAHPIHLRDKNIPRMPLHFNVNFKYPQRLVDDPNLVTCKTCLRMMKRAEKYSQDNKEE